MKKRLYLETTIASYLTAYPTRDVIRAARQEITREWWDARRTDFDLYVSQIVIDEVAAGAPEAAARRLDVLKGMPRLEINDMATELGKALLAEHALPQKAVEDALSGVVYRDDSQIVDERLVKEYGSPERVEITVRSMDDAPLMEPSDNLAMEF